MNKPYEKRSLFPYLFYDFAIVTGVIPGLLFHRPKIRYETPAARKRIRGGALLIANHVGLIDPMIMMYTVWYRRHRFICLKELFETRAGWLLDRFLCIPIDRENFGMNSFREITAHLKAGHLVSMFPEGHVNEQGGGPMQTLKSGMILMAMKGGAPIIPMYFKKRKHWYQRIQIMVGEAVDIKKLYGEKPTMKQIEELTRILYEKEEMLRCSLEQEEKR